MWEKRAAKVFISYSHQDRDFVSRLVDDIRQFGHEVWIDEKDVVVGFRISATIKRAIRRTRFFLVVISESSATSNWVRWELNEARSRGTNIIPVVLGGSSIRALLYQIPGVAYVDFQRVTYNDGLEMILRALERHRGITVQQVMSLVTLSIILLLSLTSFAVYVRLKTEDVRIETVQREVQHLDFAMTHLGLSQTVDGDQREVTYYAEDSHMVGKDLFDPTLHHLISRSYYNDSGRRIAIDRFEWQGDLPLRKTRVHFNKNNDEFLKEIFSRTGKLEKKEYDKYGTGRFIEREADFVSQFPVVLFPVFYR